MYGKWGDSNRAVFLKLQFWHVCSNLYWFLLFCNVDVRFSASLYYINGFECGGRDDFVQLFLPLFREELVLLLFGLFAWSNVSLHIHILDNFQGL